MDFNEFLDRPTPNLASGDEGDVALPEIVAPAKPPVAPPPPSSDPLSAFIDEVDGDANARARAVMDTVKDFGLDDVATATDLSAKIRAKTGVAIPADTLMGKTDLQRMVDEATDDDQIPPELAEWARQSGTNAVIVREEREHIGTLRGMFNALVRGEESLRRGANPRGQVLVANADIRAGRRALGDKNLSYPEILRAEIAAAREAAKKNDEFVGGDYYDWTTDIVGTLTAPIDAAARYTRSRLGVDSPEQEARMVRMGERALTQMAEIEQTLQDDWKRSTASDRAARELGKIEDNEGGFWDNVGDFAEYALKDPGGTAAFILETTLESAPSIASTVIGARLGGVEGAFAGGLAGSYLTNEIREFSEIAKEHGYDISQPEDVKRLMSDPGALEKANTASLRYAATVALFDAMSGKVAAGSRLAKSVVGEAVLQSAAQGLFGGAGEVAGRFASGREQSAIETIMEILAEVPGSAVEVAGAKAATVRYERQRKREVEADKTLFEAIASVAENSEARAKVPEKFAEMVDTITAEGRGDRLYVDAGQLEQLFQSRGMDPDLFTELTGISRDEIVATAERGGDITVPTSTFAAKIVGTEIDATLRQNARFDPSRMSAAEAQALAGDDNLAAASEQVAAAVEAGTQQFAAEIESTREVFETRLREAGRSAAVAADEALQLAAVYQTLSERTGISPAALIERFPVPTVERRGPTGVDPMPTGPAAPAPQPTPEAPPAEGVLDQTVALMAGEETLQGFYPKGVGIGRGKRKPTIRDVAIAMEARARKRRGGIVEGEDRKARDKIAKMMVDEIMYEIEVAKTNPEASAVGWYTTKLQAALDRVGTLFPELTGDGASLALPGPASLGGTQQAARDMLTALLAFTSDGATIEANFDRAVAVYGNWRDNAVLSEESIPGHNRGTLQINLDRLQAVLDREGAAAFRGYLLQKDTVSNLKKAAAAAGIELASASNYTAAMTLPRSALEFGPKLGAFYANLMGDTGYLTMDRWWTRTFNRYRGTLLPVPTEQGIERVRGLLIEDGHDPATLQTAAQVAAATAPYHQSYKKKGFKNGTELEKAANTIYKAAFVELNDAPRRATERQFMVETALRAQALLKNAGHDITIADIQAVLWYYEKRLYGQVGARQSKDISYEEAAIQSAERYSARRSFDESYGGAGEPGPDTGGTAEDAAGDEGYLNLSEAQLEQQWLDAMELAGFEVEAAVESALAREAAEIMVAERAPASRLPGLEKSSPGPVPGVRENATAYMRDHGLPVRHQAEYVKVDRPRAAEIARLYDEMPAYPQTPEEVAETMAAYEALAQETIAQYRAIEKLGYTFEWITGDDPYTAPRDAIVDMQENGHLWVFPTTGGFGTLNEAVADHPLLRPTGIIIDGREALVNDLFRIVHDVYGHGSEGAAFGARGEENAWQAHVRMFSPQAARAMTAETRGQNSWVNFGPHGEHNRANPKDTIFADQKVGLLPRWVSEIGQAQDKPVGRDGLPITLTTADFAVGLTSETLQQPGWYVITATREAFGPESDPRNAAAHARLRETLAQFKLDFIEVSGMYAGEPQGVSYLVIGNEDEGLRLGKEFGQDSILTNRGLEYSSGQADTPAVHAENVIGDAAKELEFYSVMPDGTAWAMGLDFESGGQVFASDDTLFQPAPPTDSEAFKNWFGDSKVVDENGEPLVVYHGSLERSLEVFDTTRETTRSAHGDQAGAYFTPDAATAAGYTRPGLRDTANKGKRGRVYAAYLSLQNPLDTTRAIAEGRKRGLSFGDAKRAALTALDREVHDGVVFRGDAANPPEYVAFKPNQIKSVNNRGTFSPNDDRVLYQSAPPVESEAFKRWFGDSKVVDDSGAPLVMYHGTGADFEAFSDDKFGQTDDGWYGLGFYFTQATDGDYSVNHYAPREGGAVMPVYLRMENPLVITGRVPAWLGGSAEEMTAAAQARGFDGVLVYSEGLEGPISEAVAFEPTQIKSVNNRGTFNPEDPRILYQSAPELSDAEVRARGMRPEVVHGTDLSGDGLSFAQFFDDVTSGVSQQPTNLDAYAPVIAPTPEMDAFRKDREKFSGRFEAHIQTSIPGYREMQDAVGVAVSKVLADTQGSLLDIGASEGAMAKAAVARAPGASAVALDPNHGMERTFKAKPQVPGVEFAMAAFGDIEDAGKTAWTEDEGEVTYFDPDGRKFDIVHEAMVFQFIHNGRNAQVAAAKKFMAPGGLFLTFEKFAGPGEQYRANEEKKDAYKAQYYSSEQLADKARRVLQQGGDSIEGMTNTQVSYDEMEYILSRNFAHVAQVWSSGNFKGYAASDDPAMLAKFIDGLAPLDSEYAVEQTPRAVAPVEDDNTLFQSEPAGMYRSALTDAVQGAKQDKAKGKDWLAIIPKLPGVKAAEIEWTGVRSWLEGLRDDTVTKAEVLSHLNANAVPLEEITRSGDRTSWEQYTEKGGDNYREFLLTVPALQTVGMNQGRSARPFVNSAHYREENIVVTARTKDRENGALFVEEVQSDLASAWRKRGGSWKNAATESEALKADDAAWVATREELVARVTAESNGAFDEITVRQAVLFNVMAMAGDPEVDYGLHSAEVAEFFYDVDQQLWDEAVVVWKRRAIARNKAKANPTPFTPFEGEAAVELMAKRLLQRAVQEGYQRLSWTPASMQARRWNTAGQEVVQTYTWAVMDDGTRFVDIVMANGSAYPITVDADGNIANTDRAPTAWQGQPLSALLGNAAAEVLAEPQGHREGANITFPSSGYAVVYDRQFKNAIEKLAKKMGGKVSAGTIEAGEREATYAQAREVLNTAKDAFYRTRDVAATADAMIGTAVQLRDEAIATIQMANDVARFEWRQGAQADLDTAERRVRDLELYVKSEENPAMKARFQRRLDRALAHLEDAKANAAAPNEDQIAIRTGNTLDDGYGVSTRFWALAHEIVNANADPATEQVWSIEITDQMREGLSAPFALFQQKRGSITLPTAAQQAPAVTLFGGADLSTVLHETGHYYLHMFEQLASDPTAPSQLRDDWATLRGWWRDNAETIAAEAGVTAEQVIQYLDGGPLDRDTHRKVWRAVHEQFARGTEAYLMEGKSPSIALRRVFATFAAWLKTVYARARGDLRVELTDEVRLVFDRLFATDEQIAEAALGDGTIDRAAAARLGLQEREIDALAKLAEDQRTEAQAYMLGVAGGAFRRQKAQDIRARRRAIKTEVEAEVRARKVYRVIHWLATGEQADGLPPEGTPHGKLSMAVLSANYDPETVAALEAKGVTTDEQGFDPDDIADFLGYESGDQMVLAIERAPEIGRAIRQETRNRLREELGDDAGVRERALPDAVNGDKRGQQLAAELRALVGLAPNAGLATTRRQAAAIAQQTIRNMPVRRAIRSDDYLAAERRAGARVQQALVRKDVAAAARAKREQLFQHALYVESKKAAELVGKAERKAKRLQSKGTRQNLAGEYLGAIDEVLETYDFRKISGKAERERGRVRAYLDMMAEQGRMGEVVLDEALVADAQRVPYKSLTVDALQGVYEALLNIEHTARNEQKLRSAQQERDMQQVIEEITAEMDANLKDAPPGRVETARDRFKKVIKAYANITLTADTRLRQYGGYRMGAAYMHLKAEIDRAGAWAAEERHRAALSLDAIMRRYSKAERRKMARKRHHDELGMSLSKWDLISAALNMGNEDNLNRLRGKDTSWPLNDSQIEYIKQQLDQRDWETVQMLWDQIGTYWPMIEARERRVTGVAPKRVVATPVETPYGTLPGGYYPIKYDGDLSGQVEADEFKEVLQSMQAGRYGKAQTRNGHTKERVGSGGRVLALDISVPFRHINEVIHDLAFGEPVANTWRILRRPELQELFTRKGRRADLEMLEIWVQDVGVGTGVGGGVFGRLAMAARGNFTMSRLAFNMSTMMLQVTGMTHSIAVVGPKHMAAGAMDYMAHPGSRITSVLAQSEMMRARARMFQPDVVEHAQYNRGTTAAVYSGPIKDATRIVADVGMAGIQFLQFYGVDVPTWLAAHHKALSEGLDGDAAAHYADRLVARAQAGTALADRSAFERGSLARDTRFNGVIRLFATLVSYMIAKGNIAYEVVGTAKRKNTVGGYMGAAMYLALLFMLEEIIRGSMKGEIDWDETDPDKDGPLLYAAKGGALSVLGVMPFIRDIASSLNGFEPGLYGTFISTLTRPMQQASKGEVNEATAKAIVNATGLFAPIPSGQINRVISAANKDGGAGIMEYLLGVSK